MGPLYLRLYASDQEESYVEFGPERTMNTHMDHFRKNLLVFEFEVFDAVIRACRTWNRAVIVEGNKPVLLRTPSTPWGPVQ
jgi:hypothetical protein